MENLSELSNSNLHILLKNNGVERSAKTLWLKKDESCLMVNLYLENLTGIDVPVLEVLETELPKDHFGIVNYGKISEFSIRPYAFYPCEIGYKIILGSIIIGLEGKIISLTYDEYSPDLESFSLEIRGR